MALEFEAGDDLVFQVESGFGVLRVLAREGEGDERVWHLLVYEEFYPDVESAEAALSSGHEMAARLPHVAITEHAFEKTPAARLGNRPVNERELAALESWRVEGGDIHDRSVLLMLGMR